MADRLPPLNSLRAFEAAQRHMSFQKAAHELHVTPAALSYQIRQLEIHLGVKLFERLNRAVRLTPEGHLIAPGIHEGFERIAQSIHRLRRRRHANVLVVSAGPAFTAKWLSPRLYRFIAAHPEIDARIAANIQPADLAMDDVDIALRFGPGRYPGCHVVKLLDECVTPLCSPALLDGVKKLEKPEDLKQHTLIHDETHKGVFFLPEWKDWFKAAGVRDVDLEATGLHFNIADHALDAAIGGAGVVLGRKVLAQIDVDAGRLVAPFDLKLDAEFSFFAVCLEERRNDPLIRAFTDWLLDEIKSIGKPGFSAIKGPAV